MAALKTISPKRDAKLDRASQTPLARVMREFKELMLSYETGLLRSLEGVRNSDSQDQRARQQDALRQEACRLAITDLGTTYMRKHIRRSLDLAESQAKSAEEQLHVASTAWGMETESDLRSIHHGHFRLYSTQLFDTLGQPTDLRFGTLRFHASSMPSSNDLSLDSRCTAVELALNSSFFVADSSETLPYHCFSMPELPSLTNRGILSRKPEDGGVFPDYDSWLLFTFLGHGCLKVEIPVEMCADVYGGNLRGRENEEIVFWGIFVGDEAVD
ncbi:hypothetical protein K491DRAFT_708402 [Lophiostoma macrostomum CBS 122681]|uniref:Uncharacterized protein n=1 Tax=Lophiostoma macrostomum CBS 122681 TaxID=1314788 RepID=A0A6A6SMP0_9PLEO|nr:hypothetical protein K491DRAFT_708402 [Lophiostoma macrostomum CBS 122681]